MFLHIVFILTIISNEFQTLLDYGDKAYWREQIYRAIQFYEEALTYAITKNDSVKVYERLCAAYAASLQDKKAMQALETILYIKPTYIKLKELPKRLQFFDWLRDEFRKIKKRKTASLTFNTWPDSVLVIINGDTVCYTPCDIKLVVFSFKYYRFSFRKPGYIPHDTIIGLQPKERRTIKLRMIPQRISVEWFDLMDTLISGRDYTIHGKADLPEGLKDVEPLALLSLPIKESIKSIIPSYMDENGHIEFCISPRSRVRGEEVSFNKVYFYIIYQGRDTLYDTTVVFKVVGKRPKPVTRVMFDFLRTEPAYLIDKLQVGGGFILYKRKEFHSLTYPFTIKMPINNMYNLLIKIEGWADHLYRPIIVTRSRRPIIKSVPSTKTMLSIENHAFRKRVRSQIDTLLNSGSIFHPLNFTISFKWKLLNSHYYNITCMPLLSFSLRSDSLLRKTYRDFGMGILGLTDINLPYGVLSFNVGIIDQQLFSGDGGAYRLLLSTGYMLPFGVFWEFYSLPHIFQYIPYPGCVRPLSTDVYGPLPWELLVGVRTSIHRLSIVAGYIIRNDVGNELPKRFSEVIPIRSKFNVFMQLEYTFR